MRHKLDLERIEAEVKAKAKAARENRDVNLEMMKASEEERRKTLIEQIRTTGAVLGAGFHDFISDRTKVATAVSFSRIFFFWQIFIAFIFFYFTKWFQKFS